MMLKTSNITILNEKSRLLCESFTGLSEEDRYRPQNAINRIGSRALGISNGAWKYALHEMSRIPTEAWKEGRPERHVSLINLAAQHNVSERTVTAWEKELVGAGIIFRINCHCRRYGGYSGGGISFAPAAMRLQELEERSSNTQDMRKRHGAARSKHTNILRSIRRILEVLAESVSESIVAAWEARLDAVRIRRMAASISADKIEEVCQSLSDIKKRLLEEFDTGDKTPVRTKTSDQSEEKLGHNTLQPESLYPKGTCSAPVDNSSCPDGHGTIPPDRPDGRSCMEKTPTCGDSAPDARIDATQEDKLLYQALEVASPEVTEAYFRTRQSGWNGLLTAVTAQMSALGVHPSAWHEALRSMGCQTATLSLLVIDRKHRMPEDDSRHVRNPGGCLRAMAKRARRGDLKITSSIFGLASDQKNPCPAGSTA